MKRPLWLLGLTAVALSARQPYTPPAFTDPDRLARIEAALPKLDTHYEAAAKEHHLPGFVYGVVVDGELVHVHASGTADLEQRIPVTRGTRFRIASMSKSFTALAVLKLRDAGKLQLDDPVARHVPEFGRTPPLTVDSRPVTLRQLLHMAGGFPQDDPWGDRRLADTVAEFEALLGAGLTWSSPPATGYEYSNLGYALLGHVVTRVAGEPYQDYIIREIFRPLGMKDTVWEIDAVPSPHLARGYRWEHGRWRPEPMLHDGIFGAMGGIITTLDDMAKYTAFHLAAWPPRDDADSGPVVRATLREMHRPAEFVALVADHKTADGKPNPRTAGYAFGLSWNSDARGVTWVRHAGGLPGFGSEYRFFPDHGFALIALANRTYAPMTGVNAAAADLLLESAQIKPRSLPPSPVLQQRAAQLAALIQNWNDPVAEDCLASNFFLDRDQADWAADSAALLVQAGRITAVTPVTPLNQLRGTFSLVGEKGRIEAFFTLMPEAVPRVQALTLRFVPGE